MKTRIFVLAILLLGGMLIASGQSDNYIVKKSNLLIENQQVDKSSLEDVIVPISNYPDPFIRYTSIKYYLNTAGWAQLFVYDEATGNETGDILVLVSEYQEAGLIEVRFDSQGLPPGKYYAELRFNNTCMRDLMTKKSKYSNKKYQD